MRRWLALAESVPCRRESAQLRSGFLAFSFVGADRSGIGLHPITAGGYVQRYIAALTIVVLLGMVLARVFMMRRGGIKAMKFGEIDKKDFLIPPFAFFYFYVVFASAFQFPNVST